MAWVVWILAGVTVLQALQLNSIVGRIERLERRLKEHFPLDDEKWNRWD